MKFSFGKLLLLVFSVGVVAALVVATLPKPLPVEWREVEQGPLEVTVDADGETRVKARYQITAPTMGRLQRITLATGQPVTKGQVVAIIEAGDPVLKDPESVEQLKLAIDAAKAKLTEAETAREGAKTSLKFATEDWQEKRRDYQTVNEEFHRRAVEQASKVVELKENELKRAEQAVKSAQINLKSAKSRLDNSQQASDKERQQQEVLSPIDGVVLMVYDSSARSVQPGTPLMEIGDPNDLEVMIDVLSTDAVRIKENARVYINQWGGDPLEGRVRKVERKAYTKPSVLGVEEKRVNVIVDFTCPKEKLESLGDGFRVEAQVVVWEKSEALKVPLSALSRSGEDWSVFVIQGENAIQKKIKIGEESEREAEVIEGLSAGDRVVVHPSDSLYDGAPIKLRKPDEAV